MPWWVLSSCRSTCYSIFNCKEKKGKKGQWLFCVDSFTWKYFFFFLFSWDFGKFFEIKLQAFMSYKSILFSPSCNSNYYLEFIFTLIRNSNISRCGSEYYLSSGSMISKIDLSRHSCPFFNPFNLFSESSLQRGRSYNVKLTIILFSLLYNLFAY